MSPKPPQPHDLPSFVDLPLVTLEGDLSPVQPGAVPPGLLDGADTADTVVRRPAGDEWVQDPGAPAADGHGSRRAEGAAALPAAGGPERTVADRGRGDEGAELGRRARASTDWATVDIIRSEVAQALAAEGSTGLADADRRARAVDLIQGYVSDQENLRIDDGHEPWSNAERRAITQAVLESLFGFGRLQPLLDDPRIENIEIYGHDDVLIQRTDNEFEQADPIAESDEELLSTLAFYATQVGRSFDPAHPRLHMSLGPTARLQAAGWIVDRPFATVRIHRLVDVSLDDLVGLDLMPPELAVFLGAAVRAKKSIMVAGAQGAGKTTLLRGLINEIDPWEKIATLESTYELHLEQLGPERHRRLVCLESVPGSDEKDANGRPIGEITMDDLARDTFRMNLDRLIVGEILGPEVIAMFEAMQTGSGSLSTIHAKSAAAVPERIVTLARKDGRVTEDFARRQVAENIDLAVYVDLVKAPAREGGRGTMQRRITNVTAYSPGEGGQVASTILWSMQDGVLVERLRPEWYEDLRPHLGERALA